MQTKLLKSLALTVGGREFSIPTRLGETWSRGERVCVWCPSVRLVDEWVGSYQEPPALGSLWQHRPSCPPRTARPHPRAMLPAGRLACGAGIHHRAEPSLCLLRAPPLSSLGSPHLHSLGSRLLGKVTSVHTAAPEASTEEGDTVARQRLRPGRRLEGREQG